MGNEGLGHGLGKWELKASVLPCLRQASTFSQHVATVTAAQRSRNDDHPRGARLAPESRAPDILVVEVLANYCRRSSAPKPKSVRPFSFQRATQRHRHRRH
eukprot:222197-Chlamydomonas_euryale.AAC.2